MRALASCSLLAVVLCGCGDVPPPDRELHRAALVPLATCSAVASAIREKALREMNQRLDEALNLTLKNGYGACRPTGGLATPTANTPPGQAPATSAPTPVPPGAQPTAQREGSSAGSYSTTNNQVAGVDEADFIKNDGRHIYVAQGNSFRIVQAWPPQTAATVAKVAIEGQARKLFVTDTHALVYSSLPTTPAAGGGQTPIPVGRPAGVVAGGRRECTYGYDCEFTGDGRPTKISIFDIRDRSAPVLVRELVTDGSYVNARRIGSSVFTILSTLSNPFPNLVTLPADLPVCGPAQSPERIRLVFEQLREKNRRIIEQTPLDAIFPTLKQTLHRPGKAPEVSVDLLADCRGFYGESLADGDAFTTVLALDMGESDAVQTASVYSRPGAVYASDQALYLAVPHQQRPGLGWYPDFQQLQQVSAVHKFALAAGPAPAVAYVGSGLVKGRVLNQFAMDERQGYLRLAATTGHTPDPKVHSTLSVLGEGEGGLETVGQLDQLAPGEDIRSVRFDDDRGYVVTFKKTDPLFVFDLADPRQPSLQGELKIPGFSTYMHRMDRNHLLTIGYDAADQGNFAYFTGVLLQIFDVSDPKQPALAHKWIIGTRGSSSEALTNHLAFNYFAPRNLLLLPMTVCEQAPGSQSFFNARPTFSGLIAFQVTTADGFREDGRVSHPMGPTVTCGNWWTNASSQVQRSIVMDDYVFSVSGSEIKVNQLGALTTDVAAVSLSD